MDQTGVWVIDPEFAMYGPMAFDVGKFIANLLLTLFATHGHQRCKPAEASKYADQRGESAHVRGAPGPSTQCLDRGLNRSWEVR